MPLPPPIRYKGPNETLDYPFDWLPGLPPAPLAPSETVSSASFTVDTGVTIIAQSYTTTNATVWLAGGTLGETYNVVCAVITNQGRTLDQTMLLKIIPT